jgi:hypothetical protein
MDVGEGAAELAHEALYVLGTALEHRPVRLVSGVVGEDLIRELQVAPVSDLLDVALEDDLILLGQRAPRPRVATAIATFRRVSAKEQQGL